MSPAYYLDKNKAKVAHKPYDRTRVRRDIHDAGVVSHKLSARLRRARKRAAI